MLYGLWKLVKKRPTRALWIGFAVLISADLPNYFYSLMHLAFLSIRDSTKNLPSRHLFGSSGAGG